MAFLLIGILLLLLKLADVEPVALWSWWIVFVPFGLAAAWWGFADAFGITAKREADKVYARADKRRERNMEAIGISKKQQAASLAAQRGKRRA